MAKARRAIAEEGPRAEMVVVLPRRWDMQRRMKVLPGVWGWPVSEEPRGTVVFVHAADVLAALGAAGIIKIELRVNEATKARPTP